MALTLTPILGIPLIHSKDPLAEIILAASQKMSLSIDHGDIFVLAQKIVSKAEGRLVDLSSVKPSSAAIKMAEESGKEAPFCELILRESREILRIRPGTIICEHRLGFVCANAGIDHSNVSKESDGGNGQVLLLPEDPDRSAEQIRRTIHAETGKQVAVMIIDSHGRAWRLGVVGISIGLAGMPGLVDMRGHPDLFGHPLRITTIAAADELAAAASLAMGQADEGRPAIHVRGFPYPLRAGSLNELLRPKDMDLFR